MSDVSGRVIVKESGIGVPGLLVFVFDVDPGTKPEDLLATGSGGDAGTTIALPAPGIPGNRLGSVVTDEAGAFTLAYEDDAVATRNGQKRRPDLFLAVVAPEDAHGPRDPQVLLAASPVRRKAGPSEQYLIRLGSGELKKGGLSLPATPIDEVEPPKRTVERLRTADLRLDAIDEGFRSADRQRVERVRNTASSFRADVEPSLREALSGVASKRVDPATFVAPGESVFAKGRALIERGIKRVVNSDDPKVRARVTRLVAMTDDQRNDVAAALDQNKSISAADLERILAPEPGARRTTTFLLRDDPLLEFCRQASEAESRSAGILGVGGVTPSEGNGGDGGSSGKAAGNGDVGGAGTDLTEDDVPRFVARLIDTMTSPEEQVVSGLEPRADLPGVDESIQALALPPSPADVPAFHDFQDLHIAFEDVWQEALDEGIVDLAHDAYQDIVELGGEPPKHDAQAPVHPVRGLLDEARVVLTSRRVVRDHMGGTIVRDHRGEVTVHDHRGGVTVRDHRGETVGQPRRPGQPRPGSVSIPAHPADRLPEVLAELEQRLKEDYAFTVYAANRKERSVNFGILITYRQRWGPLSYQAGKLAKTVTLAPKETRKYSKKTTVRSKRAEKETQDHLRTRKEEATQTSRAEEEIIRKATTKTNFSLASKGSLDLPLGDGVSVGGDVKSSFDREASKSSSDAKKNFHEAVFKASQEYKDERTTEVSTEETRDVEMVESGELSNPNDEIAVTFLFYELQRRYRISERIHRILPVVFVAQEVPRPDEIDEDWLLSYDWIISRVLLDDSFGPALNYLSQNLVGEQVALEEMRQNVAQQRQIVADLRRELGVVRERLLTYRNLLERSLLTKAVQNSSGGGGFLSSVPVVGEAVEAVEGVAESVTGVAESVGDYLFGGASGAGQSRQDAIKEAIQQTADDERDLLFRLEREVTALNALTEAYAKALAEFLNHRAQVDRLRVHVKENILYYMQAIWAHEPPDQRYFRLHKVPVPTLAAADKAYVFEDLSPVTSSLAGAAHRRLGLRGAAAAELYRARVQVTVDPKLQFTPLAEAAELDNLLGFKGNYMIFPLRESNALTDFMMDPYLVAGFDELADPDDLGNWTLEEFSDYVCCLKDRLTDQQFQAIEDQLREQYQRLLSEPRRSGEVVTVPTDSLFIAALPARHSLIEEFKAQHRAIDVKKAQSEVRERELENVRIAARILAGDLADPDIESVKHVMVSADGIQPSLDVGGDG